MSVTRRDKANAIRALSMDAVQQANSGHPGGPMGMADIAEVLYSDFLKHNPVALKFQLLSIGKEIRSEIGFCVFLARSPALFR